MNKRLVKKILKLSLLSLSIFAVTGSAFPAKAGRKAETAVYFPNWNIYASELNQVKNLPWNSVDCIQHAFWKIVPRDGGYAVISTDEWADTDKSNPRAHFPQYAEYAARYPEVKILLSIGGWSCCGYFSEMAATEQGRASFIQSCMDTLDKYPFFAGIDIDWEYPGYARSRDGGSEGNPVVGDDRANYTQLLKEMRKTLDARYGKGNKRLSVCACSAVSILKKQDYAGLFPYVDQINLMTYDMTGPYASVTGHHTALYGNASADAAVKYLQSQGVPAIKIRIGTPLYGYGWVLKEETDKPVGAAAGGLEDGTRLWRELAALEKEGSGWHAGYDETAQAAYLWNDDPASPDYLKFYTYENERSLDAKLRYIRVHSLGGMIVWESGGDEGERGYPMIKRIFLGLGR